MWVLLAGVGTAIVRCYNMLQGAGKRHAGASKRQHTAHLTHGTVRYLCK